LFADGILSHEHGDFCRPSRTVHPDGLSDSTAFDAEGRRVASTNRLGQITRSDYGLARR
jgi:YD repeat-containing protein